MRPGRSVRNNPLRPLKGEPGDFRKKEYYKIKSGFILNEATFNLEKRCRNYFTAKFPLQGAEGVLVTAILSFVNTPQSAPHW